MPASTSYSARRLSLTITARRLARLAFALAVLGMLSGCAAPSPPELPGESQPGAVTTTKNGGAPAANSAPAASPIAEPSVPKPPQDLTAIPVEGPSGSLEVDLSWAISGASDLAGYNVYRSEAAGARGGRLNPQMVLAPAYRDTTVAPGLIYRYSVTAVNSEGQESAASEPATARVPPLKKLP
jgi:hypothetical protein